MKTFISILLACLYVGAIAQNGPIDSLESEIGSMETADAKASLYKELAIELIKTDTLKSFNYASKSLDLCQSRICQLTSITQICSNYRSFGKDYMSNKLLARTNTDFLTKSDSLTAQWYYVKGVNLDKLGKNDSASISLLKCLQVSKEIALYDKMSEAYNVLGHLEVEKGNYSKALDYYQKALEIDTRLGDVTGMSSRYNNIGRIYQFKNEQDKSIRFFKQALKLYKQLGNKADIATGYNNVGYSYKLQKKYDSALIYLRKAEKIQKHELPCSYIYPIYNIGSVLVYTNDLDSAEIYLNQAIEGALDCNDVYIQALSYQDKGKLEMSRKNARQAINFYFKGLQLAEKAELNNEIRNISMSLADAYGEVADFKNANLYLRKFQALSDSLFNSRRLQDLARVEADYEYKSMQRELELERKVESINQKNKLERSRLLLIITIIGVIALLIILGILFYNFRKQRKSLELLKRLHEEIQRKTNELDEKSKRLEAANEEISLINESLESKVKKRTRKIEKQKDKIIDYIAYNSHQVRGPLARILGLVDLFNKDNENVASIIENLKTEATDLDEMVRVMNRKLEEEKK